MCVILEVAVLGPYFPHLENGLEQWFSSLEGYQDHKENNIRNKSRLPGPLLEILIPWIWSGVQYTLFSACAPLWEQRSLAAINAYDTGVTA